MPEPYHGKVPEFCPMCLGKIENKRCLPCGAEFDPKIIKKRPVKKKSVGSFKFPNNKERYEVMGWRR